MRVSAARWLSVLALVGVATSIDAAPAAGKKITAIVSKRCSTCHGPTGQGSNSQFPKIAGQNADYLRQQMFNFKSGARKSPVMAPQVADLSGDDIQQLANYFSHQRLIPAPVSNGPLREAGRSIFLQGVPASGVPACAVCHGPEGRGGQMLPRIAGQHADYIALQMRRFIDYSRTTDRTMMHSVASKMTEEEIHAVSYFLSGMD